MKSHCMEDVKENSRKGKECGMEATHFARIPGLGSGTPVCSEHVKAYSSDVVTPMTPELDARVAELQTPEGAARADAEVRSRSLVARAKLLTPDAEIRAMRLIQEKRCAFCEATVSDEDFLEMASFRDDQLSYPRNDIEGWRPIVYLTHVNCSPINGYWLALERITKDGVEGEFGVRAHVSRKTWASRVYDQAFDAVLAWQEA